MKASSTETELKEIAQGEPKDDATIKILLVDDREDNLLSMEIVLEKEGYKFYKATSGRDALKILLKEEDFSLILLDVKMPIMDGYETAELIYQRDKLRNIPIIFITAQDYEEANLFKGYHAGAVDYIRKPFNPQILRSKVAVFAELQKKNQLLKKQEEELRRANEHLIKFNLELENRVKERTLQLEEVNRELQDLNVSKDKFLSVISHDLRNPLSALLVASEKLQKVSAEMERKDLGQYSDIIHRTSRKILNQLNELVDWAKQQREKTSFTPTHVDLKESLNEWLELLKSNAHQKKIALRMKVPDDFMVYADKLMLRSVLQNLVTNAIKYTPEGGSVTVSAEREADRSWIRVKDTGIGMDEQQLAKLFSRGDSSAGTNAEKGSGLGLLLVRDFIAQHGGTIQVSSEIEKGTTFEFFLPDSAEAGKVKN